MSDLPCMVRLIDGKMDAYKADGTAVPYTGHATRTATFLIGETGANEHQRSVTKQEFDRSAKPHTRATKGARA